MNSDPNIPNGEIEQALRDRLARLGGLPVDMAKLTRAVESRVPRDVRRSRPWILRVRPMGAIAASLAAFAIAGALLVSSRPAMASTADLLRVHQALVGDEGHVRPVDSIAAANNTLTRDDPGVPALPAVSDHRVMACCIHRVGKEKLSCAELTVSGTTVTLAVADSSDLKMPQGRTVTRDGQVYRVESASGIQMAMTERGGRWACVMGALPEEQLVRLLAGLKW